MARRPYQRHSETSKAAAADSVEPSAEKWLGRVLKCIRESGRRGVTDEEQQDLLDLNPNTQRPRRVDLVRGRFVVDSGEKRLTRSGRHAVVWVAVEYAPKSVGPSGQLKLF